jgi:hypothetical protein
MKRLILALAALACLALPALADTSLNGYVVAVDASAGTVTLVPPGWHPPMQLPPPQPVDEATFDDLAWIFYNESPAPHLWLVDTDPTDGVFDSWSRY